jgi:hypothetical protein
VKLRETLREELAAAGIEVVLGAPVAHIGRSADRLVVELGGARGGEEVLAGIVLNCTYAGLNDVVPAGGDGLGLKYEMAEIALVEPPPELDGLGVTVLDGPFFSIMPFPAGRCYSLSHVRYTPHGHGSGRAAIARDGREPVPRSRAHFMIADAARYLPCVARSRHRESLFEAKALLARNERDDGRPVLMRPEPGLPGVISILGGKLDNIYDACARLDEHLAAAGLQARAGR